MNILFIGDIVSRPGRKAVSTLLPSIREEYSVDLVIANGENLAGGRGVTEGTLDEMMRAGVDYFTSGDHIFWGETFSEILDDPGMRILRPANFPDDVPGDGYIELDTPKGKVAIINLIGHTSQNLDSISSDMYRSLDTILEKVDPEALVCVDIHAEYTSEKQALAQYCNGRVHAVVGTHTHVGTADARISRGMGYVTDLGMCGAQDSVLGVESDIIIAKMKFPYPQKFEWVKTGEMIFSSVFMEFSEDRICTKIERVDRTIP